MIKRGLSTSGDLLAPKDLLTLGVDIPLLNEVETEKLLILPHSNMNLLSGAYGSLSSTLGAFNPFTLQTPPTLSGYSIYKAQTTTNKLTLTVTSDNKTPATISANLTLTSELSSEIDPKYDDPKVTYSVYPLPQNITDINKLPIIPLIPQDFIDVDDYTGTPPTATKSLNLTDHPNSLILFNWELSNQYAVMTPSSSSS